MLEPGARIGDAAERGASFGNGFAHRAFKNRDEQVVFAAEVQIDRAGGDAGGARDVGDLRLKNPCRANTSVAARRIASRLSTAGVCGRP